MVQRITLVRRNPYRSLSNRTRPVKTPGGRLVAQYIKKRTAVPKCGDTKLPLRGIAANTAKAASKTSKRQKTVSRAYGGSRSAGAVRERIVRAFLIEEQKIVKRVLQEHARKEKAKASKKSSKKSGKK